MASYKICTTLTGDFVVMRRKVLIWRMVKNYNDTPIYFATREYAEAWIETDKMLAHVPRSEMEDNGIVFKADSST
jgi:hypothetical protein